MPVEGVSLEAELRHVPVSRLHVASKWPSIAACSRFSAAVPGLPSFISFHSFISAAAALNKASGASQGSRSGVEASGRGREEHLN